MTPEDLGFLTNQKKTLVMTLPTGVKSIVVKYGYGVQISCIMPPQKRVVQVRNSHGAKSASIKIKCPDILFTSYYADIPMYGQEKSGSGHSIFVFNPEVKDRILACPYFISNVNADGGICFGEVGDPYSPREAFNIFWESPFNLDLVGESSYYQEMFDYNDDYEDYDEDLDIKQYIKKYHKEGIDSQDWEDMTAEVCGSKFWASPRGADGVLICSGASLLQKIPQKYWRRTQNAEPFIIALADKKENHWEFSSGGFVFRLDEGFITTTPHFNTKVAELKRKFLAPEQLTQQPAQQPTNSIITH